MSIVYEGDKWHDIGCGFCGKYLGRYYLNSVDLPAIQMKCKECLEPIEEYDVTH